MRQRALTPWAGAVAEVLVADEPTTALDVTVQAQIRPDHDLREETGMALILVTHDLAVAPANVDDVLAASGQHDHGTADVPAATRGRGDQISAIRSPRADRGSGPGLALHGHVQRRWSARSATAPRATAQRHGRSRAAVFRHAGQLVRIGFTRRAASECDPVQHLDRPCPSGTAVNLLCARYTSTICRRR